MPGMSPVAGPWMLAGYGSMGAMGMARPLMGIEGVLRESASSLGRGPAECVHDFVQLRAPCSAIGPSVVAVTDGKDEEEDDDDCH